MTNSSILMIDSQAGVNDILRLLDESKRREERLTHAICMLKDDSLSPKQRRRIIADVTSEYSDDTK